MLLATTHSKYRIQPSCSKDGISHGSQSPIMVLLVLHCGRTQHYTHTFFHNDSHDKTLFDSSTERSRINIILIHRAVVRAIRLFSVISNANRYREVLNPAVGLDLLSKRKKRKRVWRVKKKSTCYSGSGVNVLFSVSVSLHSRSRLFSG